MKAYATGLEFNIELSENEISRLEKEVLIGKIKVRDRDKNIGKLPFRILIGETSKESLFTHVNFFPSKADYMKWIGFVFIISKLGYEQLKIAGYTGDRVGFCGCKINISNENYREY